MNQEIQPSLAASAKAALEAAGLVISRVVKFLPEPGVPLFNDRGLCEGYSIRTLTRHGTRVYWNGHEAREHCSIAVKVLREAGLNAELEQGEYATVVAVRGRLTSA